MADLLPVGCDDLSLELEELEQSLAELEEKNLEMSVLSAFSEQILDSAKVWMQMFDAGGRILIWNRAAEAISGYARDEVLNGADIWELLFDDPVWLAGFFDFLAEARSPEERDPIVKGIRCRGGETRYLQLSVIRREADENAVGYICFGYDVTSRLEAEREKRSLEKKLMQAEKSQALVRVAKGMTHEIANPVAAIRNDLELLMESMGDGGAAEPGASERLRRILARDLSAIERVSQIITAFKSTYRPENWRLVDLNREIELQLTLLNRDLKHGVEVETRFGVVPEIYCYGNEIGQVLLNLLTNALEALRGTGRIVIETGERDEKVYARISDTGDRIDEGVRERIFDLYYTTKRDGSGLGLALGSEIAARHGGALLLEETRRGAGNHGTTFRLELARDGGRSE